MPDVLPIFVSHSHEDSAFCHALVKTLREAGADVWYDEHNLEAGHLKEVIMRELDRRKIFIVILSKHSLASAWVRRESLWADDLAEQDPTRVILPVTAGPIEHSDFSGSNGWLFLGSFKRIEASGYQPYPQSEAIRRTLHALSLTPAEETPTSTSMQQSENIDSLITRGTALRERGRYDEALSVFERATMLEPRSYNAWFNVGYALSQLNREEHALAAYDRAINLKASDAVAWNNKGATLCHLRRYTEALAACEHALALDPKMVNAWNNKGTTLRKLKHYTEALAAYERALLLDPDDIDAWIGKGAALQDGFNSSHEALAAYERALLLDPQNAKAWRNKAEILNGLKRYSEAFSTAEQAIVLDALNAVGWQHKASALRGLRRIKEAEAAEARARTLRS